VVGCNRAPEDKDAVRRGVIEHLKKGAALDLNAVDIDIKDVKYQGNEATAQVGFKPKNAPEAGMTMSYTLERRGSEWIVKGRGAGHGEKGGMMGGGMGGWWSYTGTNTVPSGTNNLFMFAMTDGAHAIMDALA
jgi:hypothetical protein